jgi:hypothetical protein
VLHESSAVSAADSDVVLKAIADLNFYRHLGIIGLMVFRIDHFAK